MSAFDSFTGSAFREWLREVTEGPRVPPGQRLDPFATSMRVFKKVPGWLDAVRQGERPVGVGDRDQYLTDLIAARLVEREAGEPARLTRVGQAAHSAWNELELVNDVDEEELARCIVVLSVAARNADADYIGMMRFWRELRAAVDVDELLSSSQSLYAVSYFNQEYAGFNPWEVMRLRPADIVQDVLDWDAIKQRYAGDDQVSNAVDNLSRRIVDAAARVTGRRNFCRAMELLSVDADAPGALDRWGIEGRERDLALAALSAVAADPVVERRVGRLLIARKNIVLYGPPGTGKTRAALQLADRWRLQHGDQSVFSITFHPSYGYEDFVQGYRPTATTIGTNGEGGQEGSLESVRFELIDGVLLKACERAEEFLDEGDGTNPRRVLLLIDEINRGDTARIFGELITYIEGDKRGVPFRLAQTPTVERTIPSNLYVLGTMNTADKSISLLDIAMRRRFAFVGFPPDPSVFQAAPDWLSEIEGLHLSELLRGLNERLLAIGIEPDCAIGQALLRVDANTPDPFQHLRDRFEYDICPLVLEFCFLDRRRIATVLGGIVDSNGAFRVAMSNAEFMTEMRAIAQQLAPEIPEPVEAEREIEPEPG